MKNFGGEIGRKYGSIDLKGRKKLRESPNEIQEFPGFDSPDQKEATENTFNVSALFEGVSVEKVKDAVTERLKKIAEGQGLKFITAADEFPLHSTLELGEYQKNQPRQKTKQKLFSGLSQDPELINLVKECEGLEIEFKYLLMDKSNVLLTAVDIPQQVLDLRAKLTDFYLRNNLKPLPIENMLHVSLGRMVGFPEDPELKAQSLKGYEKQMVKLRHELSSSPIKAKIGKVFLGITSDLLHNKI